MTKHELAQIYWLNKEIKMWTDELRSVEEQSHAKGQVMTGMPGSKRISDKVGDHATLLADIRRIIEGKLAEVQLQRLVIMEYIGTIDDSALRQIINMRCVSCQKWAEIAEEMGYSERHVKRLYYDHFENVSLNVTK